jgi:hypothetical protein
MSEIIKTINQTDPVTIQITVNSAAFWEYDYADRGTHYAGKYNDGKSHTHAIGLPGELHLSTDAWTFRFINTTGATTGFVAKIEWLQNQSLIHTWSKTDNVASSDLKTAGDDGVII